MSDISALPDIPIDENDLLFVQKQTGKHQGVNVAIGDCLRTLHPRHSTWDEESYPGTIPGSPGLINEQPNWVQIPGFEPISVLEFASHKVEGLQFTVQNRQTWVEGTGIEGIVRWINHKPTGLGGSIVWRSWLITANPGGEFTGGIHDRRIVQEVPEGAPRHNVGNFGIVEMPEYEHGSIALVRIYRDTTDDDDTYGDSIGLLQFNVRYQRQGVGEPYGGLSSKDTLP